MRQLSVATAAMAVLLAVILLFMVGCSSLGIAVKTPRQAYYVARAELNANLDGVLAYAQQPKCSATVVIACHDPAVVSAALDAALKADALLDGVEAALKTGDQTAVDSGLSAARAALLVLAQAMPKEAVQ